MTDVGGDSNTTIRPMVTFENLSPSWVSPLDSTGQHNAAYNWYFWSFADAAPLGYSVNSSNVSTATGNVAASASTSDSRLQSMMGLPDQWSQLAGTTTANPVDDSFKISAK